MTALLWRARNGLFVTAIGLMLISLLAPAVTLADTSLTPGSAAVVSGTNGDGVTLRGDMSTNAPALQTVPEGTPLQILDGPLTAADGSVWYSVSVNGTTGYVAAAFVSGASNADAQSGTQSDGQGDAATNGEPTTAATEAPQEPVSGPAASTIPWKQAIAYGVVNDNIGQGVPDAGIVCRADVSTGAAKITQVSIGDTVEITGEQVQSEGLSWYPVNCAGVGGFIDANFVQVSAPEQTGDTAQQNQTDQTAQEQDQQSEVPTEVATEVPTEVATVAPTEAPAETDAQASDQQNAVQQAPDQTDAQNQVETVAPTEAPTEVQTDVQTSDLQSGEGQAPEQTVPATEAPVENAPEVAVTDVATQMPAETTGPADVPATDAPATVAPTETQTEPAADTAETEVATVEATAPATTTPVERSGNQPAAATETTDSTPAATVAPAEANATVEATQAADVTATTETTKPATKATEPAKETADATQTVQATQPAKGTAAATETATQGATATAAPTKAADETPAAEATKNTATPVPTQMMTTENATPAVDLSKAIGSAEVKGTNGDGVRCRVSPADDAATIAVLAEGTKVSVMGMPSNGWLPIACGDQIGYTNLQYMWQGGAVQGDFSSGDTGATVKVQGTGNGLNCRTGASTDSAVITVVFDGTNLVIRGMPRGNWLPVTCGGQAGYVYIDYVSAPQAAGGGGSSSQTATSSGTATVSGTGGDGLRCRTAASTGSAVITVLADGTRVTTRGGASNGWLPVICGGQNGYIYAQYATVGSSSSGSSGGSSGGSQSGSGTTSSGSVVVTGTGNGLNCRTGASTSYGVITVVFDGTTLKVRGAASNGWIPVVCGGQNGYVSSDWVSSSGGSSGNTGSNPSSGDSGSTVTGSATVTGTGGDGVRCRTGASTSNATITVVGEGQTVSLRGSASNGWQPVVCGGQNGYIYAQYLSSSSGGSGSNSGSTGGLGNGSHAQTTDALNLRYEPSLGAGVATVAPAGTVVLITGGATNGYYPVDWDGLKGYMAGDYLVKTDAALSKRGGSADDPGSSGGFGDSGGSSATGNAIVDYAMGYLGYPYVWATHGPASFDCSGFVYWVVLHVLGRDIGTGLWTQVAAGTPVSRSALQPGDIVFFQNTYEPGLSHDGIYIGGGKFIHAENETTGVKISDLGSTYYSSRWYGAVRLG